MILEWEAERQAWGECSRMREKRYNHAVSTVSLSSGILAYCSLDSSERSESNRQNILDFIKEQILNKPKVKNMYRKYKQGLYVIDSSL